MLDKKKTEDILEKIRKNGYPSYDQGYYCEPSSLKRLRPDYHPGVNCSDIDDVEEKIVEYRKEYFKKHICRKATPEELEWIRKQPKVDLDSPEHEHLKPILHKLLEEGWFD